MVTLKFGRNNGCRMSVKDVECRLKEWMKSNKSCIFETALPASNSQHPEG
jgi:hypothetical protein